MSRTASCFPRWARGFACLLLAGALARAQVRIACDPPQVRSREECLLEAVSADGDDHEWRWSLSGAESQRPILKPVSRTAARVTAPPTRAGAALTVVLEDVRNPSIRAECRIPVLPSPALGCTRWQERDEQIPGSFTPALSRFQAAPEPLLHPSRLCFCDDAFAAAPKALRRLNRCWIVAGAQGLRAFGPGGEAVALPSVPGPGPGRMCRAVAVLPPGSSPDPGAPRLVYSESTPDPFAAGPAGDQDTRIFALGLDGTRRELELGEAGTLGGPRTVRDLALDREGNVFAALSGGRGIWRIDPAGRVTLHALLPETAPLGEACDGILALALDPATGDLYAADGWCVQRVSPAGKVSSVLPPGRGRSIRPCHLAFHGRELLVMDAGRQELLAFHLDSRRLAKLLGGGEARLGPVRRLNPGLPADLCARLGGTAPLASNQEGLCLLGRAGGLALLELPREPITGLLEAREAEAPAAAPPPVDRPTAMEHCRSSQARLREYKRELRLGQKLATLEPARETVPDRDPTPCRRRIGAGPRWNLRRVGFATLLAWSLLANPSTLGVLAQSAYVSSDSASGPPSLIDFYTGQATATLDQLDLACGPALLAGAVAPPCDGGYRTGVMVRMNDIFAQMEDLLVEPATLGAGACLAGESPAQAKERIALAQGDILASYDGLAADASTLLYQMDRDGFVLQAVGTGLLAGQAAALAAGSPLIGLGAIPEATLGSAGEGLIGVGFAIQSLGNIVGGHVGSLATAARARYQRYANSQDQVILRNCTGSRVPAPAPAAGASSPDSPLPALQDALQKLNAGCALAEQHHLDLQVCGPETLEAFRTSNGTVAGLYQAVACLASGVLESRQAACPRAPLGDARTRVDTLSYFSEFNGEIGGVGWILAAWANGLFAGAEGLFSTADLAMLAGNGTAAAELVAAGYGLSVLGNGLFADGFNLLGIGAQSQRWQADVAIAFNAQSRTQLDGAEARERAAAQASSSASATGAQPRGPAGSAGSGVEAPAEAAAASPDSGVVVRTDAGDPVQGSPAANPATSGAVRPLPLLAWLLAMARVQAARP